MNIKSRIAAVLSLAMFAPLACSSSHASGIEDAAAGLKSYLRGSASVVTSLQAPTQASSQDPADGSAWPLAESARRRLSACLISVPAFSDYASIAPWAFGYLAFYNHQRFLGNSYANSIFGVHLTNALTPRGWSAPEYVINVVLPPVFGYFVGRHYSFVTASAVTLAHFYGASYFKKL